VKVTRGVASGIDLFLIANELCVVRYAYLLYGKDVFYANKILLIVSNLIKTKIKLIIITCISLVLFVEVLSFS
jgi:hypothetical protein